MVPAHASPLTPLCVMELSIIAVTWFAVSPHQAFPVLLPCLVCILRLEYLPSLPRFHAIISGAPTPAGGGLQTTPGMTSPPALVEVGQFGLEGEIERLKRDKNVLMLELVRLRQQQQQQSTKLQVSGSGGSDSPPSSLE